MDVMVIYTAQYLEQLLKFLLFYLTSIYLGGSVLSNFIIQSSCENQTEPLHSNNVRVMNME